MRISDLSKSDTVIVSAAKSQLDRVQVNYHGQSGIVVAVGMTKVAICFDDGKIVQFDPSLLTKAS